MRVLDSIRNPEASLFDTQHIPAKWQCRELLFRATRNPTLLIEAGEGELRFGSRVAEHAVGNMLAERGTVFEAVAGTAADEPHVRRGRMVIDDEMRVGRLLVLTDA